ncbi:uncharacterized protein LOC143079074 [Mytilus galloprovincialis]|uniref:uncharacterized protein LOC143079074 n=1 Tax=Mytilus galloprovincialis TaxID=29158 RepID=UPI003F7BA81F
MEEIKKRIKDASNETGDILLSLETRRRDVDALKNETTKFNETLEKEKKYLDFIVKEIANVKTEHKNIKTFHGEIEIVRRSADNCLSLKDNVSFIEDTIKKINTQIENLKEGLSFIQQEHNRSSQKLKEFDAKLIGENNFLNKNSKEMAQLEVTIEQLNVTSTKLDESFKVLETVIANCSAQMDKCKETAKRMEGIIDDEIYLNSSINTLKKEVEILNTNISTINGDLIEENNLLNTNSIEVAQLKEDTKQLNVNSKKLNDSFDVLETVVANCSEQMDKCKETVERMEGIIDDQAYLNSSFKILEKEVEILNTSISTINGDLIEENNLLNANSKEVAKLKEGTNQLKVTAKKLDDSFDVLETVVANCSEQMEKYQKEYPSISKIPERVQTLNETINILSKDIKDKWVLVQRMTVAFVITVLSLCGGLLYSRKHKIDDIEKKIRYLTENKDKPSLQYESLSIVEQIKRRQPEELENKFCVISFSQETHNKHRRITRPSVEGRLRIKKMDEADFVVTNDKSVLKIPHCKVILVFVDHNQKDVILETPGEDEEDIKLLTVQACRKMGADVFVIYVGDEGSESLMAGCLYNPQLTTVAEHFELKQLEQRNRVITCHEKFTITQREKVAQAIA